MFEVWFPLVCVVGEFLLGVPRVSAHDGLNFSAGVVVLALVLVALHAPVAFGVFLEAFLVPRWRGVGCWAEGPVFVVV